MKKNRNIPNEVTTPAYTIKDIRTNLDLIIVIVGLFEVRIIKKLTFNNNKKRND